MIPLLNIVKVLTESAEAFLRSRNLKHNCKIYSKREAEAYEVNVSEPPERETYYIIEFTCKTQTDKC